MSQEEIVKKLTQCPKVSQAEPPSLRGTSWTGRVIYVKDADTLSIARYCPVSDQLEARTIRITMIDAPEVPHTRGNKLISEYETMLGFLAKSFVLHKMLPDQFAVTTDDLYGWRMQKKIFDSHPVLVQVNCPSVDSRGKKIELDPYSRDLGSVNVIKQDGCWDIAQSLIATKLVDAYEGGSKKRSFMTSLACLDNLGNFTGENVLTRVRTAFAQRSSKDL